MEQEDSNQEPRHGEYSEISAGSTSSSSVGNSSGSTPLGGVSPNDGSRLSSLGSSSVTTLSGGRSPEDSFTSSEEQYEPPIANQYTLAVSNLQDHSQLYFADAPNPYLQPINVVHDPILTYENEQRRYSPSRDMYLHTQDALHISDTPATPDNLHVPVTLAIEDRFINTYIQAEASLLPEVRTASDQRHVDRISSVSRHDESHHCIDTSQETQLQTDSTRDRLRSSASTGTFPSTHSFSTAIFRGSRGSGTRG